MDHRSYSAPKTQPWPTSRPTPPLDIPSPRPHTLNAYINAEWQNICLNNRLGASSYSPRGMSQPPSLSPSPSPSASSYEIEEIEELSEESDSGIEVLIGEYEEAPENYRKELVHDSGKAPHKSIIRDFERLSARNKSPSPMARPMNITQQRLQRGCMFPIRKSKRRYAESVGSEASSWGDSGVDSEEEERKVGREMDDCVSIHSYDEGSDNYSDNEIDMEL